MKRPVSDLYCPAAYQQLAAVAATATPTSFPTAAVTPYSLSQCLGTLAAAHPVAAAAPFTPVSSEAALTTAVSVPGAGTILSHPLTNTLSSPPPSHHLAAHIPVMHFIDQVRTTSSPDHSCFPLV